MTSKALKPNTYLLLVTSKALKPNTYLLLVTSEALKPNTYLLLVTSEALKPNAYLVSVASGAVGGSCGPVGAAREHHGRTAGLVYLRFPARGPTCQCRPAVRSLPSRQRGGYLTLGGGATPAAPAKATSAVTAPPSTGAATLDPHAARGALVQLGAEREATRPLSPQAALHADTPLPPGRGRVEPVVVPRAVDAAQAPGVTAADLPRLRARLAAGDRAGMYLELYQQTGQEIWLMHAQITSYSGVFGGAAITANFLAKGNNPEKYHVALDTFSRQIAASMVDVVEEHVAAGGDGKVDVAELRKRGDWGVWDKKGMGSEFPGNGLFVEFWHHGLEGVPHVLSHGTAYGLEAIMKGADHGKRPAEFRGNPRYDVRESEDARFVTVTDKKSGKTEAFFDRQAKVVGTFGQIADEALTPHDLVFHTRAALWEYMQANQDAEQPFDARPGHTQALATPSVPAFGADHGLLERRLFRDPSDGRWYGGREREPVTEGAVIESADRMRHQALSARRALGLPDEPPLPGRYLASALYTKL